MKYAYSPYTGEIIHTEDIADWMGATEIEPPQYDKQAQGCFWRDGGWVVETATPEPTPVPTSVTRRQARLALLEVGKLQLVESAIDAIPDPTEKMAAQINYEADTWDRDNPFLNSMWEELGGAQEELDSLFILASTK